MDTEWAERLPHYAEALQTGGLVICAACHHYRSREMIAEAGRCAKTKESAYAFVPFECPHFCSVRGPDPGETWLAATVGADLKALEGL